MDAKANKTRDFASVQKDLKLAGLRIGRSAEDAGCGTKIFASRDNTPAPRRGRRVYALPPLLPTSVLLLLVMVFVCLYG